MTASVVGFIGLGAMGAPMCGNLASRSGATVLCHDLDPAAVELAASRGASPVSSLAELAERAEIVFLCLANADATRSVASAVLQAWGAPSSGALRILVDTGTTSVQLTRELQTAARGRGHRFVDAPVARMPAAAVAGTLSFMVGGDPDELQRIEPLLRCMGTDITRCGPVGCGQVVKILHNTLLFETVHAVAEALAIAGRHGVDGKVFLDAVELGSANCDAARVQVRAALLPRAYPTDRFPTTYAMKDVGLALELAREGGVDVSLAPATQALLQKTAEAGFGHRYYPVLFELLLAGTKEPASSLTPA